eukprot:TRINITY_DN7940_c0_g1_i3.p1 TRINITY_DN7940_c0_g1~~TRINITY_DN7940_c0_g1_i3.p1  ORF type:complete len:288 (+),score=43.90 TRINITY_DN7940_c0_g1_i3:51-914(+)
MASKVVETTEKHIVVEQQAPPEDEESPKEEPLLPKEPESPTLLNMLFNAPLRYIDERFSPGSMKGSVFTLLSTALGTGMIALPAAISKSGLIPSIIMLLSTALIAQFTGLLLTKSYEVTKQRTFLGLATSAFGPGFCVFVKLIFFISNWGSCVPYTILINNLCAISLRSIFPNVDFPAFLVDPRGYFWQSVITMTLVLPMSLYRRFASLRWFALIGFCCFLYIAAVLVAEAFDTRVTDIQANLMQFWKTNNPKGYYSTLSTLIYAFIFHQIVIDVYAVYSSPSQDDV